MSTLAVMLTRRCNMACGHCSVESGPKAGGKGPHLERMLQTVREASGAGVEQILLTGGEPMLRQRTVLELLRECRRLGMRTRMTSNGFWGRSPDRARGTLAALLDAGLDGLVISYDRFHAAFQGPEPVVHIARAASELDFRIDVNVTRLADDGEVEDLVAPFADVASVRLRFYDVQPVGAARHLPGEAMRSEVEGFCSACGIPALTDDGRITACNGPSYFDPPGSPLAIGSLEGATLGELLRRHQEDPILDTIRTEGPAGLRDVLVDIPGFERFVRERYAGMCDLCHHITSSPEAVAALRPVLSTPHRAAVRAARQRLIEQERAGKTLSRAYVNTQGAARAFLSLAVGRAGESERVERVLGRADLDWRARAEWLVSAGLARPILARLDEPALARWAPGLFRSRIARAAVTDEARELAQRSSLRRLAVRLREAGVRGTVLGGAAHWDWDGKGSMSRRAVPAIEIVVWSPGESEAMLERFCRESSCQGISLRTRIVPESWGVPELEILRASRPIPEPALAALGRPTPSDGLVCAMVGASATGLRGGLEMTWDVLAALAEEPIDDARVVTLAGKLQAPRGFWVPARVLAQRMDVPIPAGILDDAPHDRRQLRLEQLAARRLFHGGSGSPLAEWGVRWIWPALAAGTAAEIGLRLPRLIAQIGRELPAAWRDIGAGGLVSAMKETRRVVGTWNAATK